MTSAATSDKSVANYTTGTLRYTKFGLFTLFSWLLWGDFCYTLMEGVRDIFPTFLIAKLHMSNQAATIMSSTIPQILGVFVGPAVSFKSDRTHSRFGRRIPYIIFTAPFLCLFLAASGFSGQIADYLTTSGISDQIGISSSWAILLIIGFLTIGFTFFNEFVGSVYYYLFNDVVPLSFMGRFQSLFRIVGTGATALYQFFIFKYSLDYMHWVFLGAAIVYLVGIALMCWRVREGQYPPSTDVTEKTGIIGQIGLYFRECFTHRIYIFMFLCTAFIGLGFATLPIFNKVFTLGVGVTMEDIGYIGGALAIVQIIIYYPCGWLVDKFHPIRISLITLLLLPIIQIGSYFFIHGYWGYVVLQSAYILISSVWWLSANPLLMNIFPREKYGQFCSANGMARAGIIVLGSLVTGKYLDWLTDNNTVIDNYRYAFLLVGFLFAASLACLLMVYVTWKKLGGQHGYKPPVT
jgi:maltose/moltooligosaccharide transporter